MLITNLRLGHQFKWSTVPFYCNRVPRQALLKHRIYPVLNTFGLEGVIGETMPMVNAPAKDRIDVCSYFNSQFSSGMGKLPDKKKQNDYLADACLAQAMHAISKMELSQPMPLGRLT